MDELFAAAARDKGKSARTRARLMDAALSLFARDGFEAASVNEIARRADVANGTFYVHFKDKDEIAAAVAFGLAHGLARRLDAAMAGVEDAVERVATATRRFVELAAQPPDLGRALFKGAWTFPGLRGGAIAYLRADLERGVAQGVFSVQIDQPLLDAASAMTLAALLARLDGAGPEAASRSAELQLRMLGVAPDVARAAAYRSLPPTGLPRDGGDPS